MAHGQLLPAESVQPAFIPLANLGKQFCYCCVQLLVYPGQTADEGSAKQLQKAGHCAFNYQRQEKGVRQLITEQQYLKRIGQTNSIFGSLDSLRSPIHHVTKTQKIIFADFCLQGLLIFHQTGVKGPPIQLAKSRKALDA